jgi:hypothetical protein
MILLFSGGEIFKIKGEKGVPIDALLACQWPCMRRK